MLSFAKTLHAYISVMLWRRNDVRKLDADAFCFEKSKWQRRWDIGEFGRDFYLCKPFLDSYPRLDFPNTRMFKRILQLRTGYSILNDYRHKLGQCESGLCECGQMETVQHYLRQCQLYEEERNILYNRLREQLGRCLNTRPNGLGFKQLPRDPANVNARKKHV